MDPIIRLTSPYRIVVVLLVMILSLFCDPQEETLLFKDPLNKAPLFNPVERATGTLANEIGYSFFIDTPSLNKNDISNLRIDENQGICWGDGTTNDGDYDRNSVTPRFSGGINFVSANNPKELFNWGPHLAGKHYIIRFSSMRGNSNPLSFGIRENDSLEGSWKLVSNRRYYLALLNLGKHLVTNSFNRFNIPEKDNEAMIESEGAVKNALQGNGPFEWKIEIDETTETAKIFINEEQKYIINQIQASGDDRYFHFFYAPRFGGTLSNFSVSVVTPP